MTVLDLDIPEKVLPLYSSDARYKVLHGGRGSSKSWTFSDMAIIRGYEQPLLFACLRQYQSSIRDSVHRLLSESIDKLGLHDFFTIQENKIMGANGTEYIFKGLARNINNIKSLEGANIAWITEAVDVTKEAWQKLIPTIRRPGSEIWLDFNPEEEDDPTYERFVNHPPEDSIVIEVNFPDNPFFPDTLKKELEYDLEFNPDEVDNIWYGKCKKMSQAQVFHNKWETKEFDTPEGTIFYYGSDWGNSGVGDPDTIIRCFESDGYLYIDEEQHSQVKEIEDYTAFYEGMKDSRNWDIICDNTMEKFRKYINSYGFRLKSARKGPGSIDSGIKFLRSYKKIYIHPRCKKTIFEFKNYRYKVDPHTSEVIDIIVDKHNHLIDSLRYAVERLGSRSKYATTARYTKRTRS